MTGVEIFIVSLLGIIGGLAILQGLLELRALKAVMHLWQQATDREIDDLHAEINELKPLLREAQRHQADILRMSMANPPRPPIKINPVMLSKLWDGAPDTTRASIVKNRDKKAPQEAPPEEEEDSILD